MGRNPVTPEVCHGRREPMDRNPVTPTATDPSRALSTERRATTRRQPSYTDRLITDRASIMVRAGVGEGGGGGRSLTNRLCLSETEPQVAPLALQVIEA